MSHTMAKTREELLTLLNAPEGLENLKALMETEPAPATGRPDRGTCSRANRGARTPGTVRHPGRALRL